MEPALIRVRGARTHNLRDLDLDLPRDAWTVVCGVSGSGKSSLVLDTLGAESRRRFLATLLRRDAEASASRPDVDRIEGLPPAVVAGFVARRPGPRSTLGTLSGVTGALRVLALRIGVPHCPTCDRPIQPQSRDAVTAALLARPEGTRVVLLASRGRGGPAITDARSAGFVRVRVGDGPVRRIEEVDEEGVADEARVAVVVDRLVVRPDARDRFAASVEQGLDVGGGLLAAQVTPPDGPGEEVAFADRPHCPACARTWPPIGPAHLAHESPVGACDACAGRGEVEVPDPEAVLPRELRIRRVAAHLRGALSAAERQAAGQRVREAAEAAGLGPDDRLGDLPERARHRLLGRATGGGGLLARVAGGRRVRRLLRARRCEDCDGERLGSLGRGIRVAGSRLPDLASTRVDRLADWLEGLDLADGEAALARPARDDALERARFLQEVGLGYLAPARAAATLSGGELRRARLAAACAARMSGLLFLLDEPTAGLHPVDRIRLRARLRRLVEEGNTLVCVEHDPAVLGDADHVVELGPGAGEAGGRIVAAGPASEVLAEGEAPIARALAASPAPLREGPRRRSGRIVLRGARRHDLAAIDVAFPHEAFTCITGPSGSGKSTLALEVLVPAVRAHLAGAPHPEAACEAIEGVAPIDRVAVARGAPPRHPRATPATVLGVLGPLRALFAATLEARARGWGPGRFSPHVEAGRCPACRGKGERVVGLRDLAPARVPCEVCEGRRFAEDTLRVRVKGLSIADVLALPLGRAARIFADLPRVARPLAAADEVGLGYVPLGEPTSRLSGGEALRLRLAAALGRGGTTPTLYVLDEPAAGLHPQDVEHLRTLLLRLTADGATVVAVEHHPGLVRVADHVVELGPGAGPDGGQLVYAGSPAGLAAQADAPSAPFLRG